ncbi:MAG: hypothetical protein AB1566_08365 [Chloroflexota bacterium]
MVTSPNAIGDLGQGNEVSALRPMLAVAQDRTAGVEEDADLTGEEQGEKPIEVKIGDDDAIGSRGFDFIPGCLGYRLATAH